jgi:hypothetical protein
MQMLREIEGNLGSRFMFETLIQPNDKKYREWSPKMPLSTEQNIKRLTPFQKINNL